jgi:hypothetical protein
MYKVVYYLASSALRFKAFKTLTEATEFANKQPLESVIEIKYYDETNTSSDNNRPALWCEK